MKDLAEIVFIMDRSGSMETMRNEAVTGFNAFVEEQKKVPGEANLTLVLFNQAYEIPYSGKKLADVPPLTDKTYVPAGTTALLDAVGRTIDDLGKRLDGAPESDRPTQVIVVVLTDGLENASHDYRNDRIKAMIEHQQSKYSWKFLFLGANQDAFETANGMGIPRAMSVNYSHTPDGYAQVYAATGQCVKKLRTTGKGTLSDPVGK